MAGPLSEERSILTGVRYRQILASGNYMILRERPGDTATNCTILTSTPPWIDVHTESTRT